MLLALHLAKVRIDFLPVFGGRPQQASTGGQDGLGRDVPLWLERSGALLLVLAIEPDLFCALAVEGCAVVFQLI